MAHAAAPRPLIPPANRTAAGGPCPATFRWSQIAWLAVIFATSVLVYLPTLRNGFLPFGFDDAVILDTGAIRAIGWQNLRALATEFNQAHYVPLTMLSLALDYRLWGLDPFGYHLHNMLLHGLTAVLVCAWLWPILPSRFAAGLAALIFAVHPIQMEAVTVAMQRKTLLSGAAFVLTLILYRHWRSTRRRWCYAGALVAGTAACLAKPMAVTLPLVLLLYDYVFVGGRVRIAEKLPFFAAAALTGAAAIAAHAAVGAVHPPHGGDLLTHLLLVSRVTVEQVVALLVPLDLSPIYYYPRDSGHAPVNFAAAAVIVAVVGWVSLRRRRYPWAFFCLWFFVLVLLPESNLIPLAQLRADRFLYLGVAAFGIWVAVGIEALQQRLSVPGRFVQPRLLGAAIVLGLALITVPSAAVWRSNITAWRRVAEHHPWSAMAQVMLGRAYEDGGDLASAERAFRAGAALNTGFPEPYLYLAKLYADHGLRDRADDALRRLLELAPDHPDGLRLLRQLHDS